MADRVWVTTTMKRHCEWCNKGFMPYSCTVGRFCSPTCYHDSSRAARAKTAADRFWAKVSIRSDAECWPWLGYMTSGGYGQVRIAGKGRPAHVVAWELHHAQPFPDGMHGCHSCDNPICVNPHHIWPGTQSDNMWDASRKGRLRRVKS